jgi:hypothetical protein
MEHQIPEQLRAKPGRLPFRSVDEGYEELHELDLQERINLRVGELDRFTGRASLDVPPTPEGSFPAKAQRAPLPPADDAVGGSVEVVRGAWVAKFNPKRAQKEVHRPAADRDVVSSDAWRDYKWGDPSQAMKEPWINSWLMQRSEDGLKVANRGDLVFVMRTEHLTDDLPQLARRTIVGLWWIESITSWREVDGKGKATDYMSATGFPVRRFNFPVPVVETGQADQDFNGIAALRDRSRGTFIELDPTEALHMARACGLPASVLTESDPDRLAPQCVGLDLGPSWAVRQRILDGAKAADHRKRVEALARNAAVNALVQQGFGVVSTELERGADGPGADLLARCYESDGTFTKVHVEVKGLSGPDPWAASLTKHERRAAVEDGGAGKWWMLIVTDAQHSPNHKELWLTSEEAVVIFSKEKESHGKWVADRTKPLRRVRTPGLPRRPAGALTG